MGARWLGVVCFFADKGVLQFRCRLPVFFFLRCSHRCLLAVCFEWRRARSDGASLKGVEIVVVAYVGKRSAFARSSAFCGSTRRRRGSSGVFGVRKILQRFVFCFSAFGLFRNVSSTRRCSISVLHRSTEAPDSAALDVFGVVRAQYVDFTSAGGAERPAALVNPYVSAFAATALPT